MSGTMRSVKCVLRVLLLLMAIGGSPSTLAKPVYRETVGRKGGLLARRPAMSSPTAQLAYAQRLEQAGRRRAAARQYLLLTRHWPDAPEAGQAQYRYARMLEDRRKWQRAFDEYNRLFEDFVGRFPYDEILDRQFQIAQRLMEQKKGKFLFLPGFSAPEQAIPLFEKILAHGPRWEKAAEAQFLIGRARERGEEYEEAIGAYMATEHRYPDSPFAELAAFQSALCYYRLALESPNNEQFLENAWAAWSVFVSRYPASERRTEAEAYRNKIRRMQAQLAHSRADYYDRIARRPKAALITYRSFVNQFPDSEWTPKARERIAILSKLVEASP